MAQQHITATPFSGFVTYPDINLMRGGIIVDEECENLSKKKNNATQYRRYTMEVQN